MLLIGTQDGVYQWNEETDTGHSLGLNGKRIRDLTLQSDHTVVAVESGQRVWSGRLPDPDWTEITPDNDEGPTTVLAKGDHLYLGGEPPVLYQRDQDTWWMMEPLHAREYAKDWYAPGGLAAVRSMAAHPTNEGGLYLDIHVGGIMRTLDGGETWTPTNDGLELDVHEVATHAMNPDAVYAATADGFYYSPDEGDNWERRNAGLENLYTRGIAIHPQTPDIMLISGSPTNPGGWRTHGKRFALYRSEDGGGTWMKITAGLPAECPDEIDTFCIIFSTAHADHAYCGRRDGILHKSTDAGASWTKAAEDLPNIYSVKAG